MGPDVLLAVDPGIRACGAALFLRSTLVNAALVRSSASVEDSAPLRCAGVANAVRRWSWTYVDLLIVEWPQVYRAGRVKRGADSNDLLLVSGVCAALATVYRHVPTRAVLPREWKGTLPKEVACERVIGRLSPDERAVVDVLRLPKSSVNHVLDAVGIGLHILGRGLTISKTR